MSDALRLCLVGATGLIGGKVMEECVGREDVRLQAIARREAALPSGIRIEYFVADPAKWGEVFEALRPKAVICALGTTWKKAGEDEAAFRAVDQELVLQTRVRPSGNSRDCASRVSTSCAPDCWWENARMIAALPNASE